MLLDWPEDAFAVRELPEEQGPGNILLLEAEFEHVTEVVSGFGKLGVSAEQLAKTAAERMAGYLASDAFAGPYLADQLLLPFALAGGGALHDGEAEPAQPDCCRCYRALSRAGMSLRSDGDRLASGLLRLRRDDPGWSAV